MGVLAFQQVTKKFGDVTAVDRATLTVDDGEFVVLVGPSGCGKTTLLRLAAGLESVTGGDIYLDERRLNDLTPRERNVAMVFQDYALYPHMTVFQNMAFGLLARKLDRREVRRRVESVAATLGLDTLLERKPRALSGGQRQRVAMGRAIVREPAAFLFDEPLSNLDAKLRVQMRTEIRGLCKRLAATSLYVTHDQTEAMTMADRIVVIRNGRIQQIGTPRDVYDRPANRFVGGFIGSPAMNFIHGAVVTEGDVTRLDYAAEKPPLPLPRPLAERAGNGEVWLGIRPEAWEVGGDDGACLTLRAQVAASELLGRERILVLDTGAGRMEAVVAPESNPRGATTLAVRPERVHLFRE